MWWLRSPGNNSNNAANVNNDGSVNNNGNNVNNDNNAVRPALPPDARNSAAGAADLCGRQRHRIPSRLCRVNKAPAGGMYAECLRTFQRSGQFCRFSLPA